MPQQATESVQEQSVSGYRFLQCLFVDDRKSERLPLTLPLTYSMDAGGVRLEGHTLTENVSGGGLRFPIPKMVSPDTPCHINLKLPDHLEPLLLRGRIAWCRLGRGRYRNLFEVGIALEIPREYHNATFSIYCRFIATQLLEKYLGGFAAT